MKRRSFLKSIAGLFAARAAAPLAPFVAKRGWYASKPSKKILDARREYSFGIDTASGPGATAIATVTDGVITSVTIISAGSFYKNENVKPSKLS